MIGFAESVRCSWREKQHDQFNSSAVVSGVPRFIVNGSESAKLVYFVVVHTTPRLFYLPLQMSKSLLIHTSAPYLKFLAMPPVENFKTIQVSGDVPPLPWVGFRVADGLGLRLGLGKGWVDTSPDSWRNPAADFVRLGYWQHIFESECWWISNFQIEKIAQTLELMFVENLVTILRLPGKI